MATLPFIYIEYAYFQRKEHCNVPALPHFPAWTTPPQKKKKLTELINPIQPCSGAIHVKPDIALHNTRQSKTCDSQKFYCDFYFTLRKGKKSLRWLREMAARDSSAMIHTHRDALEGSVEHEVTDHGRHLRVIKIFVVIKCQIEAAIFSSSVF